MEICIFELKNITEHNEYHDIIKYFVVYCVSV